MVLFWPALFIKGKQATIDAGTVAMVETMDDVTFNTYNFKEKEIIEPVVTHEDSVQEDPVEKKVMEKPKSSDFKTSTDYQKLEENIINLLKIKNSFFKFLKL